jgi:hypothetical protein
MQIADRGTYGVGFGTLATPLTLILIWHVWQSALPFAVAQKGFIPFALFDAFWISIVVFGAEVDEQLRL